MQLLNITMQSVKLSSQGACMRKRHTGVCPPPKKGIQHHAPPAQVLPHSWGVVLPVTCRTLQQAWA